jgi:membrane glycosyltransferase
MFLPDAGRRRRGEIGVEEAVATAKLNDARSIEEACAWLKPKERLAVLGDRALIAMLARLPARSEPLAEADVGVVKALHPPIAAPKAGVQGA